MRISVLRPAVAALASLALAATALLVCGAQAGAFTGYVPTGSFGGYGTASGLFKGPGGVAIEEATGDVYVVDSENNRVQKFDAAGKFLSEFNGSETPAKGFYFCYAPYIAVNNSTGPLKGDVYVQDGCNQAIDRFNSSGVYQGQAAPVEVGAIASDSEGHIWEWGYYKYHLEEFSEDLATKILEPPVERGSNFGIVVDSQGNVYVLYGDGCVGRYSPPAYSETNESGICGDDTLAINPATNNIFADAGSVIYEWPAFGEGKSGLWSELTEEVTGGFTNSQGLAINGKTGTMYVSDASSDKVEIMNRLLTPDITTQGAHEVTDECVTLEGNFDADATKAEWYFEYGETTAYGSKTVPVSDSDNTSEPVSVRVCGLSGYSYYHYRLVGHNENGTHLGRDGEFRTYPFPPVVEAPGGEATEVSRTRAVMKAQIDPSKNQTSYYFEYGETTAYGRRTALSELASSEGDTSPLLAQAVAGELKSDTVTHFRVVARNSGGTTIGPDVTFTSGSLTPPVVETGGVSNVSASGVTLEGLVTTQGLVTSYGFEISTNSDAFGPPTGLGSVGAGFSEAPASLTVTGLKPATKYYYKLVGTNPDGSNEGEVREFTTGTYPPDQIAVQQLRVLTEPFTAWPLIANPLYVTEEAKTRPPVSCKKGYVKKNGKCIKKKTKGKGKPKRTDKGKTKKKGK